MLSSSFNNFIKTIFIFLASSLIFSFSACKNNKDSKKSGSQNVQNTQSLPKKLSNLSEGTKVYLEGKKIILVLGYGYNDPENITKITASMEENFGLDKETQPGLIKTFIYPQDFLVAGKERITSFADKLEGQNLAGIVVLGAPGGLYRAISKMQDKTEDGKLAYPVFTFFSQDDVLGSESTSDFVLDYAHKTDSMEGEITDTIPNFDVNELLINSVSAIMELRQPLPSDASLPHFIEKLLSKDRKIVRYIDGETGLQSINHFVFE